MRKLRVGWEVGSLWRSLGSRRAQRQRGPAKDVSTPPPGRRCVASTWGAALCFVWTPQRRDVPALQSQHPRRCPRGLPGGGGRPPLPMPDACGRCAARVCAVRSLRVPEVTATLVTFPACALRWQCESLSLYDDGLLVLIYGMGERHFGWPGWNPSVTIIHQQGALGKVVMEQKE